MFDLKFRDRRLFLNPKDELSRQGGMQTNPPPRAEAIGLMAAHPHLVRWPILVSGRKIPLSFNEEEWSGL